MSALLGQLFALGYWVSIIVLCLKDRFKLAVTLIIISNSKQETTMTAQINWYVQKLES